MTDYDAAVLHYLDDRKRVAVPSVNSLGDERAPAEAVIDPIG